MKRNEPLLSVVMPVYNSAAYITPAITSILKQTYKNFELLVIDDGSKDKTAALVTALAKKDPRLTLITLPENGGISRALNEGIKRAQADLIVRADGDDICLPERFAVQLAYLQSHPEVGVVGSWYETFEDDPDVSHLVTYDAAAIKRGWPPVNHPTTMIRKHLFTQYGGYNSAYNNAEDTELWYRWYAHGVIFDNVPQSLYKKRVHTGSVSVSRLRSQVGLMLKLNLQAVVKYHIPFSLQGYRYMAEQALYWLFLTIKPAKRS